MGSSKKSSAPSAPAIAPPAGVQTPFGNATYSGGTYTYSSPDDAQNLNNMQQAYHGFSNALGQVSDPSADIAQQQQVYRNAMMPAFDQESNQRYNQTIADLGDKYYSTFGALTANQAANQEGIARAQVEKNIYDSGQSLYDQMMNRAAQAGNLATAAQQMRIAPYQALGGLTQQSGNNVSNFNNAQVARYQAQVQQQSSQQQNDNQGTAQLAQVAAQLAPVLLGI